MRVRSRDRREDRIFRKLSRYGHRRLARLRALDARRDYLATKPRCACHRVIGRCAYCCSTCGSPYAAEYFYPNGNSAGYLCHKHADCWCLDCQHFCAGMEDFDFSPIPGICGDCRCERERQDREYDEPEDDFLDEFGGEDVPDWDSYEAELGS